jgi:hypothetical protein
MNKIRPSVIKGVNKHIEAIRQDAEVNNGKVDTYVSLYTFNSKTTQKLSNASVNFLENVTEENYQPEGDTAMFDAVGVAIDDYDKTTDTKSEDNSYLVIVVSDGQEWPYNCSKTYTRHSLSKKIKDKQETGRWTFVYLGANQDLGQLAKDLNIPVGNFANYSADHKNSAVALEASTNNLKKYLKCRAGGQKAMTNFHSDDKIMDYSKLQMSDVKEDHQKVPDNSRVKSIWRNTLGKA